MQLWNLGCPCLPTSQEPDRYVKDLVGLINTAFLVSMDPGVMTSKIFFHSFFPLHWVNANPTNVEMGNG